MKPVKCGTHSTKAGVLTKKLTIDHITILSLLYSVYAWIDHNHEQVN